MDRVVATYQVGIHDVVVVEVCDEDGSWFQLVVDGLARDEVLDVPPAADDLERLVLRRADG
jgi:hypothetical protein